MKRIVAFLLLLLFASVSLFAQDEAVLREYGSLQSGDRRSRDGVYEDRIALVAPADGTLVVTLVSPDFEPLVVVDVPGQELQTIGGNGNALRVSARVVEGDEVELRVSSAEAVPEPFAEYLLVARYAGAGDFLTVGATINGSLEVSDEVDNDGSYIDYYDLDLQPDTRVRVAMSSDTFDTFLVVELPNGDRLTNDDFNGTDSSLTFSTGRGGIARVGATSFGFQSTGGYLLTVADVAGSTIRVGDFVPGDLTGGSATFTLAGEPGDLVAVELRSTSFDTYLELTDDFGNYLYNDDAESFDVSRIVYEITDSGEANVIVSASFGEGTGPFTLEVLPFVFDGTEIADGYRLSDGENVAGSLGPHLTRIDGTYEQRFTFDAERGERVEIVLRSDEIDSFLRVVAPDGSQSTDDDGAGYPDSRLVVNASEAGIYDVYASDLSGSSIGSYTLSFRRLGLAELILSTEGELTDRSLRDITGKYYETYDFEVTAGASVTIDVRSDDYDGYALVRSMDGEILYRDDDSGGSGNPRIEFVADRSERLQLVVTTYSDGVTGAYSVEVFE